MKTKDIISILETELKILNSNKVDYDLDKSNYFANVWKWASEIVFLQSMISKLEQIEKDNKLEDWICAESEKTELREQLARENLWFTN